MEWEAEAKAAIDRAPFFVRRMARRKVEEAVRADGRSVVTLADVRRAKESAVAAPSGGAAAASGQGGRAATDAADLQSRDLRVSPLPPGAAAGGDRSDLAQSPAREEGQSRHGIAAEADSGHDVVEPESGLSAAQIRLIESLVDQIPGQETRYWTAKGCGGAVGCPLTVVDVGVATAAIAAAIERSGFADAQAARLRGPVLSHHRLKTAVAGCANCCSEPQIKDFALVARARPYRSEADCLECGACEAACKEDAVRVVGGEPEFASSRCVGCGGCAEACESGAIQRSVGYDVLVGGRLGRHPSLARVVAEGASLDSAVAVLEVCLRLLVEEGRPGERLGALLDRVGYERIGATGARAR